jgi:hypothetical protein
LLHYQQIPCECGLIVQSLQPNGTEKNLGLGELSEYERKKLTEVVVPELKANIQKAVEFCEAELGTKKD